MKIISHFLQQSHLCFWIAALPLVARNDGKKGSNDTIPSLQTATVKQPPPPSLRGVKRRSNLYNMQGLMFLSF
jgi:hypothetical protein